MAEHGKPENHQAPNGEAAATSARVFISYSSHDAEVAQKVCSSLEAVDLRCWIAPRDVVPGTLYAHGIVRAIDETKILVLVLSTEAVASAHVGRELERAASKGHPIVALRIDAAPLTPAFEYFLNQSQWIETGTDSTDGAIARLVEAVGRHLSPGTAAISDHTAAMHAPAPKAAAPRRGWIAAAAVAVVLAGAYLMAGRDWLAKHETGAATASVSDKSIAVLPFTDMSEKRDQEYFADGMAEEIIDLLVKVPGLKVISRTSSFQFKGRAEDLRSIGTTLGVAFVLEGSVRKSGDHLRVTAQLIDSRDGTHLFSQTYDRDLIDVLKMQDEIAASLVRVLQVEVTDKVIVSRPALRNTQAYTLYLQGLHAKDRFDQEGFEQAVNDFQQAVDLDPSFGAAAGGLANAYFLLGQFGFVPPSVAFEKARSAAELALKLDPTLAATHALLGNIDIAYTWDWPAAEREIGQALAAAPRDPYVLFVAAIHSQVMGRFDDGLKQINASLAQDPLNPSTYLVIHLIQMRRDRLAEAEVAIRRTLEISPTFSKAHYFLGVAQLLRGQSEMALTEITKETDEGSRLAGLAIAYFALGRKSDSDGALARLLKGRESRPFEIAGVHAFRGESDDALKWLERAYTQKDPYLCSVKGEVTLKKLEGDPRFKAFLKKLNLPE